jgi:hypothetical protein
MPDSKIIIREYLQENLGIWNNFVDNAKNGIFLFNREYLEYHQDRFKDFSLMCYKKGRLIAIFPAHVERNTLASHNGLTFGGFVTGPDMKVAAILDIFEALLNWARDLGFERVLYKRIPHIYHQIPADEDAYALFINEARLVKRDQTSTINLRQMPIFKGVRRKNILRAIDKGLHIVEDENYPAYWRMLEKNLQKRYEKRPTHTCDEITALHQRFPNSIRLFSCYAEERMIAGVVIYESKQVAHTQYIASSDEGREFSAVDLVLSHLILDVFKGKPFFDFGISTEQDGRYLNRNLAFYKEGFGAGTVTHDIYEVKL